MKVLIDFRAKEVHFDEWMSIHDMATYLLKYFPEDTWGSFKFMIDGRTDENPDTSEEDNLPF